MCVCHTIFHVLLYASQFMKFNSTQMLQMLKNEISFMSGESSSMAWWAIFLLIFLKKKLTMKIKKKSPWYVVIDQSNFNSQPNPHEVTSCRKCLAALILVQSLSYNYLKIRIPTPLMWKNVPVFFSYKQGQVPCSKVAPPPPCPKQCWVPRKTKQKTLCAVVSCSALTVFFMMG